MSHECNKERELDLIHNEIKLARADIKELLGYVSGLRVKAGIWGATSGAVSAIGAMAIYLIQKKV